MGVVYSPEEVSLGHVAQHGHHVALNRHLLSAISMEPIFPAAMGYGSVAAGHPDIRSDNDMLIIYISGRRVEAVDTFVSIEEAAKKQGIFAKAEPHFEPHIALKRAESTEREYIAHFRRVQEQHPECVIGDPLQYLNTTPLTPQEVLEDAIWFIARKVSKFTKAYRSSELDLSDLQRAYELPVAIARKVQQIPEIWNNTKPSEDKQGMREIGRSILEAMKDRFPSAADMVVLHNSLCALDLAYTGKLIDTLKHRDDPAVIEEYEEFLVRNKKIAFEKALSFSEAWQEILDRV